MMNDDLLKMLNSLSPYVRRAWEGDMPPEWQLKERVLYDYELVYIMDGEAEICIEDRTYCARPGDAFIFRPGVKHCMKTSKKSALRQPHVHFDLFYREDSPDIDISYKTAEKMQDFETAYFRQDINMQYGPVFPEKLVVKNKDAFERHLLEIIREYENPDAFSFLSMKSDMLKIIAIILEETHGDKNDNPCCPMLNHEKMNSIKEFLRVNYRSKINLDQLAGRSNMSKSHMLRLFKLFSNTSPLKYQMSVKIEKACLMLVSTQRNISEISQYLGFVDLQHFSRVFKKYSGINPSAFREKQRKEHGMS